MCCCFPDPKLYICAFCYDSTFQGGELFLKQKITFPSYTLIYNTSIKYLEHFFIANALKNSLPKKLSFWYHTWYQKIHQSSYVTKIRHMRTKIRHMAATFCIFNGEFCRLGAVASLFLETLFFWKSRWAKWGRGPVVIYTHTHICWSMYIRLCLWFSFFHCWFCCICMYICVCVCVIPLKFCIVLFHGKS